MRVVAVLVDDLIKIKEAGLGNALLAKDLDAGAAFGVVWHKPCRAERDDAWVGANGGWRVFLEGLVEFLGCD